MFSGILVKIIITSLEYIAAVQYMPQSAAMIEHMHDIVLKYNGEIFNFRAYYIVDDTRLLEGGIILHGCTEKLILKGHLDGLDVPMGAVVVIFVDGHLYKCDYISKKVRAAGFIDEFIFRIEYHSQLSASERSHE